jgi:hypothetical protein
MYGDPIPINLRNFITPQVQKNVILSKQARLEGITFSVNYGYKFILG